MVYRTAHFQWPWTTPNPDFKVRWIYPKWLKIRPWKANRKPYLSFQMVPFLMTLSDLLPTCQGHDIIHRQITRLIVSPVWSTQWFHFQWSWVTVNLDFKVTGLSQMPSTYCVRSWRWITISEPVNHFGAESAPVLHSLVVPPWVGAMSTSKGWGINRHIMLCTSPCLCSLVSGWGLVNGGQRRSAGTAVAH